MQRSLLPLLVLFAIMSTAHAQESPDPQPPPTDDMGTLSISPLHLLIPMGLVQVEAYLGDHASISVIGGVGEMLLLRNVFDQFTIYAVGGQVRGYFAGTSKEGTYAGLQVLHVWLKATISGDFDHPQITGLGAGTNIGALIGHKWVWPNGFVIDLAGGVGYAIVGAAATDGTNYEKSETSQVAALVNFNIGYAF